MSLHETKERERIPFGAKIAYGSGAFVNNLLAGFMGSMAIVLNLGLGMSPALVGLVSSIPRFTDAITDPMMGYISDNTRTRWGRRRPFIFIGAVASGLLFFLLWQMPADASEAFHFTYFLVVSILFYLAYTTFATPWVALGYEMTPDYHERTRLMGVQNFVGQFAYIIAPWGLWYMKRDTFSSLWEGAQALSFIVAVIAIGLGVLPAILLRERVSPSPSPEPRSAEQEEEAAWARQPSKAGWIESMVDFLQGFKKTLQVKPFLLLCVATFLVFNGFMLVSSFQSYVIIYYVFQGDEALGAEWAGYSGTLNAVAALASVIVVTALSSRLGKRRAFFVAIGLSVIGYALKWVCYNPDAPWMLLLPVPLFAFGLGGLFTLMPSMVADVVDFDELSTHKRREGMFGAIFWWVVKVGMAAALALGGFLLEATGFNVELGPQQTEQTLFLMRVFDVTVPALTSCIAILAVARYSITEEKAFEIRSELDARRGVPSSPEPVLA